MNLWRHALSFARARAPRLDLRLARREVALGLGQVEIFRVAVRVYDANLLVLGVDLGLNFSKNTDL